MSCVYCIKIIIVRIVKVCIDVRVDVRRLILQSLVVKYWFQDMILLRDAVMTLNKNTITGIVLVFLALGINVFDVFQFLGQVSRIILLKQLLSYLFPMYLIAFYHY